MWEFIVGAVVAVVCFIAGLLTGLRSDGEEDHIEGTTHFQLRNAYGNTQILDRTHYYEDEDEDDS